MSAVEAELSYFDRLGGAAVVRRIVDRFYDLMETDPAYKALRDLHAPDLGPMRESLSGFLTGWLGGPRDWFEARPGTCMMSMHSGVAVDGATAAQWREAMARALADAKAEPAIADLMNGAFSRISENMRRDVD